jgi:hypothetical protein
VGTVGVLVGSGAGRVIAVVIVSTTVQIRSAPGRAPVAWTHCVSAGCGAATVLLTPAGEMMVAALAATVPAAIRKVRARPMVFSLFR